MKEEYLLWGSLGCLVLAALIAVGTIFAHKRKWALRIMTGGVYLALFFLFLATELPQITGYSILIAADSSLDVLTFGYKFKDYVELFGGREYRVYAMFLYLLAPVLTVSNVLSFFQRAIDRLRYVFIPGEKYILSELNNESIALAESIRKKKRVAQIVFAGTGSMEKKNDSKLWEKARDLNALCLKQDISRLSLRFPLRKNWVFLISRHEPENVSDALALIDKYKESFARIYITAFVSSPESKLAIDSADKGKKCLHWRFGSYLRDALKELIDSKSEDNWAEIGRILDEAPLRGRFAVRCVDAADHTVRNLLKEHYATIHNRAKENDRVIGMTILGFGKHGAALVKNAAWIFQFYGYRLQFNIFDLDGKVRKYLQQEAPMLLRDYSEVNKDDSSHDILFMGEDDGIDCLSSDYDQKILETYWHRIRSTQMVFVSLGDDSKNIAAAIHFRQLFQCKRVEEALEKVQLTGDEKKDEPVLEEIREEYDNPGSNRHPLIFAVVNDPIRAKNLEETSKEEKETLSRCNYHITPVSTMLSAYHFDNLKKMWDMEKAALKNHLVWDMKTVLESEKKTVDANTLDRLKKNAEKYMNDSYYWDSSMATTLHQMLLAEVKEEFQERTDKDAPTVRDVKMITEKMRWNAYMRARGYQYSPVRIDRLKFHKLVMSYHELPLEEREKDLIEFTEK